MRKTLVVPAALIGLLAPVLAACGDDSGSDSEGEAIRVGTTDGLMVSKDNPAPLDPVAAYDINTWNVLQSTFQTLMRMPRTGTEPEPDAAKSCEFTDRQGEQYRCDLRSGMKFSNGHELTSQDVKFSFDRMLGIRYENGPYSLLTNVDKVETPDDKSVVFHLKSPDATFPSKLATPAAAIVDQEVYPAKGFYKGLKIVGSGPYALDVQTKGGKAVKSVYSRNKHYKGALQVQNDQVEVSYYKTGVAMEKALKGDRIDLMSRSLNPSQVTRLRVRAPKDIKFVEQGGQEIRYLTFNTDDPSVKNKAVRRAMAQVIDRDQLTREVYQRTAESLYSLIPRGMGGHSTAFYDVYGDPDPKKAGDILRGAGIDKPVKVTLSYTTDHYGTVTKQEFELLQKQLNDSGLFDAKVKGVPWEQYNPASKRGDYAVYGMGWFPDFADPDNYSAPFFGKDNFMGKGSPYRNSTIDGLITKTRKQVQRERTTKDFEKVQEIMAADVPILPLWQGKQYVAARDNITGVEWALNASSTLQMWELRRGIGE
ncbi:peptide-binding protein [Streptomyces sp. A7024]|uniref:Peptide-binding protein n=1 Tax=Streptomyces coryli TaxID=1128680 RepID=A0A6G4U0U0_9ACTN|nr:peptide-binding protein [Streptomyces coryli]